MNKYALIVNGTLMTSELPSYSDGIVSFEDPAAYENPVVILPYHFMPVMVYDRTLADVSEAIALRQKVIDGTATEEDIDRYFVVSRKGFYNFDDMNRVEIATGVVSYAIIGLTFEIDECASEYEVHLDDDMTLHYNPWDYIVETSEWSMDSAITESQTANYLANVIKLQPAIPHDLKNVPTTLNQLTYDGANRIEEELHTIYETAINFLENSLNTIKRIADSYIFSGEIYGGE